MSSSCLGWHRDNGMNFVTLFSALSLTYLSGCVMHEVHDSRLLLKEILTTCNRIFGVNSDLYFIELVEFLYNWSALIALHFANWRQKSMNSPKVPYQSSGDNFVLYLRNMSTFFFCVACSSTPQQQAAFTCHVKPQPFQSSPHSVNPVTTTADNPLMLHIKIPNTLKVSTIVWLLLVFKSAQVKPTIQLGQLGFKEPHWMAAKIPHNALIATTYSEIMIQTMQQVSKEYQVPLSRRFLLSSINTYAL